MRHVATLPQEAADKFIDYLETLSIAARPLRESGGVGVWVCDEDRVAQARQELRQFLEAPSDPRYEQARAAARALRRREQEEEENYARTQLDAEEQLEQVKDPTPPAPGPRPLTFAIMALCVLVAVATNLGQKDHSLTRALLVSTQPPEMDASHVGLIEVRSGEVWRLVTPILLHFEAPKDPVGIMHLVFNLFLFLPLAGQVESIRGTGRFAVLVLVLAVASNLTQYYLGNSTIQGVQPILTGSEYFGGLSGVVYGLFGYVWLRGRLEPDSGLGVSTTTAVLLVVWLLFGPVVEPKIANGAHFGGLLTGALIGAAPHLWRRPPARDEGPEQDEESDA